jgi:hypothetical protein
MITLVDKILNNSYVFFYTPADIITVDLRVNYDYFIFLLDVITIYYGFIYLSNKSILLTIIIEDSSLKTSLIYSSVSFN